MKENIIRDDFDAMRKYLERFNKRIARQNKIKVILDKLKYNSIFATQTNKTNMKKFFLLLALLVTTFGYPRFHHSHHSSHHSSGHSYHSSGHSYGHSSNHNSHSYGHTSHATSHPTYHPVTRINRSHVRYNSNTLLYYYLLRNNNTHRYDTIKANSVEELNSKVVSATEDDNTGLYWFVGIILFLALIFLAVPFIKK